MLERILPALTRLRRAPLLAALTAMLMVATPFALIYFAATTAVPQERPKIKTIPPPSLYELENTLRSHVTRDGNIVSVKADRDLYVMPLPTQWAFSCSAGMLWATIGTPDKDNLFLVVPSVMTEHDCAFTAANAGRILRHLLD